MKRRFKGQRVEPETVDYDKYLQACKAANSNARKLDDLIYKLNYTRAAAILLGILAFVFFILWTYNLSVQDIQTFLQEFYAETTRN